MRKKLLSLVAIATIVFFGACSNEELLPEPDQTFTFTFEASMPQKKSPTNSSALDNPATRVGLEEVAKDIELTWEEDDVLQVVVTQGTNIAVGTAPILSGTISADGKKAKFNPSVEGDPINTNQPFNFYGVYGGGGLSSTNPTDALLQADPYGSLTEIQNNKNVMLYFAHEGVTPADISNGVTFNHLGSLFKITVRNNCPTGTLNLEQGARLVNANATDGPWAFDSRPIEGLGNILTSTFDLTSQMINNTENLINFMSFSTSTIEIAPTEVAEYWAWFPVMPDNNTFPELKLTLVGANPNNLTTVNSTNARTTPIITGKNYRFYAAFDGTNLNFTDDKLGVQTP